MERAAMTDAELLDAIFEKLLAFLKHIPACLATRPVFRSSGLWKPTDGSS
jgi:hypothetical protein